MTDLLIALLATAGPVPSATAAPATQPPDVYAACAAALPVGARVLFQGDSITDMSRGRDADPNHLLGHSYAFLIGARVSAGWPERSIVFIDRRVVANKVADLAARWTADAIDLKPDVLSILIGINDLKHNVPAADYGRSYDALLARARDARPAVRLVLLEPFSLPKGNVAGDWSAYSVRLAERRKIVADLATKYGATFVPLQSIFERATDRAPAAHWISDGVHPTPAGQQIIADAWVAAVAGNSALTRTSLSAEQPRSER